jgi:hypothetical protein
MAQTAQNYKSHRRIVPGYHGLTFLLELGVMVGGIVYAFCKCGEDCWPGVMFAVTGLAMILATFYARQFAIKAQDRGIRAEENLRHYVMTGKLLDSRLRLGQIIALRFASDDEYLALIDRAIAEKMKPEDIKKAIKTWRPDTHRV